MTTTQLGSGAMFDAIAPRYDLMNRLISLGLDQSWRRQLVESLASAEGPLLDVATGTADVALALAKAYPDRHLTGLDPSVNMLAVGRSKVAKIGWDERITLVEGDAQAMSFPDDHFAGCCISFGIRNVPDRLQGLKEMARVTRPGGVVSILELGEPRRGLLAPFARFHVHTVVPTLGTLLSGSKEYRYLAKSIAAFPPPEEFAALMAQAGLRDVQVTPMSWDAAHLYVGRV
jgi:demethylmenaquinone methyltransferase/2-methoxy-6-polyprenyl-1,4-benzoquinol methylase